MTETQLHPCGVYAIIRHWQCPAPRYGRASLLSVLFCGGITFLLAIGAGDIRLAAAEPPRTEEELRRGRAQEKQRKMEAQRRQIQAREAAHANYAQRIFLPRMLGAYNEGKHTNASRFEVGIAIIRLSKTFLVDFHPTREYVALAHYLRTGDAGPCYDALRRLHKWAEDYPRAGGGPLSATRSVARPSFPAGRRPRECKPCRLAGLLYLAGYA